MSSSCRALLSGSLALIAAAPLAVAQPAAPPASAGPTSQACGFNLGAAATAEWEDMGGVDGRLGCPTANETATVPSPTGAQSDVTAFGDRGAVYTIESGAQAGKAFAITGCAWRLFFGYGGAGSWLGLPVEDAQNNPDGQTQKFEGGVITQTRATSACDAEPTGPASESH
ncbi:MAG TPA: hypothetical protein VH353_13515 [Caulobacteraceae bacterium]|nr:hypothetical protein [Caulobacteraceae bacterium]